MNTTILAIAVVLSIGDGLWETRADDWAAIHPEAYRSEQDGAVRFRHRFSAAEGGQVLGEAEFVFKNARLVEVWARRERNESERADSWAQLKEVLSRSFGAPSRSVRGCLDEWENAHAYALYLADGVAVMTAPTGRLAEKAYLLSTGPGCNTATERSPAREGPRDTRHCDAVRAILASKGVGDLLKNCFRRGERILLSSSAGILPARSDCLVNGIEVVRKAEGDAGEAGLRIILSQVEGHLRFVADYGLLRPPKCPPGTLCGSGSGCGSVAGSLERAGGEWSVGQ